MSYLIRTLCLFCVAGALLAAAPPPALAQHETEITGTITGYDGQQSILTVNTRLGSRGFLLDQLTLILLNNHAGDTDDFRLGDRVLVSFRFDTAVASRVHIFREARQRGKIVSASNTAINYRVGGGAALNLRLDANSRVELAGIPLSGVALLAGRRATAVYEPGTFLLLSLSAEASSLNGRVQAVNVANGTLTLTGGKSRVFTVDPVATIRRDGRTTTLSALQPGDRVRLAFTRGGAGQTALAVQARGPAVP